MRIVVLGAGVAGLAAFDALVTALAASTTAPSDLEIVLVEADGAVGGRAQSFPLAGPTPRHPRAPWGTNGPHGVHFVWGSYAHLARLLGDDLVARLSPTPGTATYCAWMAPPDLVGDQARVTAIHVCDPSHPESAWNPRARRLLQAFADEHEIVLALERLLEVLLGIHLTAHDLLSYMDILFDEDTLGPELRWTLLFSRAIVAQLGAPETNAFLELLLGKTADNADIGEIMRPLFHLHVMPRMRRARRVLAPVRAIAPLAMGPLGRLGDARAALDLVELLARDAAKMVTRLPTYDPRASGFLKNALKAAFSNPYALDVGTMMRDAQFGLRDYEGAVLRLFDGDDSRALWEAIAARAQAKLPGKAVIKRGRVACALRTKDGRARFVDLADHATTSPPDAPTLAPARPGPVVETLEADFVISTLLPRALSVILPSDAPLPLKSALATLGEKMNETLNLQLFFPRAMKLPLVDPPSGVSETPPFSISNLEGPFTIVVDLARGWSKERFEAIKLAPSDGPFRGTAWELVGTFPECFTFDPFAHPGRAQWPLAVQQRLAALTNDPNDFDPARLDERAWVHDLPRFPQPVFGEVRAESAAAYQERWTEQATPIIVGQTMRLLAALPGLDADAARYLEEEAERAEGRAPSEARWVLYRACHAENRFFSAELGLFSVRPHARFQTALPGLWVAGDWTRNGLNLQAMEAATISGLQAATGVLEILRTQGVRTKPPHIDPSILPPGAWDAGPEV